MPDWHMSQGVSFEGNAWVREANCGGINYPLTCCFTTRNPVTGNQDAAWKGMSFPLGGRGDAYRRSNPAHQCPGQEHPPAPEAPVSARPSFGKIHPALIHPESPPAPWNSPARATPSPAEPQKAPPSGLLCQHS